VYALVYHLVTTQRQAFIVMGITCFSLLACTSSSQIERTRDPDPERGVDQGERREVGADSGGMEITDAMTHINCYRLNRCDGPEDCGTGEVCCAHQVGRFHGLERRAPEACVGSDELITCNIDDDCPDAQLCCAGRTDLDTPICRAGCLSGF
jgi:hypothetical protein